MPLADDLDTLDHRIVHLKADVRVLKAAAAAMRSWLPPCDGWSEDLREAVRVYDAAFPVVETVKP